MDTEPRTLIELGHAAFNRGELDTAETHFRAALAAGESRADVHDFVGYCARQRGAIDEAGDHYAAALELAPADAAICNNLGNIRKEQKRMAEAIALFRRAATLSPDSGEIQANIGVTLVETHRPDLALPYLERALELRPDLTPLHDQIAMSLCALNRYRDALPHYSALYRALPCHNDSRYLESLALLALGDYANGWRRHEVRFYAHLGREHRPQLPEPAWLGEDDIAGRTILLHAEQGFGDTCQFVRYVPMVAALGARVRLIVQKELYPLLKDIPGPESVIGFGDPLPDFEMQCSLMSLPRAFRTELHTVPDQVPYIEAPPDRVLAWARKLGKPDARRRVALAWSGSNHIWNRALPLAKLAPLLARRDCEFHVVQTDIRPADRDEMTNWPNLVDHSGALKDFADTAALLTLMDRVLTIDTVMAHLAGGMALPTWTMLALGADYRWLTAGTHSPWYPTMRLFRQPAFGDWDSVVADIGRALDEDVEPA
ncbi:MAG: tetratricopeptide repeat protein [Acetobacteraceae bacterium]